MSKTHKNNGNTDGAETQVICASPKPFVQRVQRPDGSVLLVGVSAAARWLGVKQPTLSQLARGTNAFPITWEKRARTEFPELFAKEQA